MQQCAGSVAKKESTWRSAKSTDFLWDGWFSDTISRRGPIDVMSSCISPIAQILSIYGAWQVFSSEVEKLKLFYFEVSLYSLVATRTGNHRPAHNSF